MTDAPKSAPSGHARPRPHKAITDSSPSTSCYWYRVSGIGYRKCMGSPTGVGAQHRSMADAVTAQTRRLILSRQLQPAQRITQADLAEMMGVSTMPVREAL